MSTALKVLAPSMDDGIVLGYQEVAQSLTDEQLRDGVAAASALLREIVTERYSADLSFEAALWSPTPVGLCAYAIWMHEEAARRGVRTDIRPITALQMLSATTVRSGKAADMPEWWFDPEVAAIHSALAARRRPETTAPLHRYAEEARDAQTGRVEPEEGQYECACSRTRWVNKSTEDHPWYVCIRCGLTTTAWIRVNLDGAPMRFEGGPLDGESLDHDDIFLSDKVAAVRARESFGLYGFARLDESDDLFSSGSGYVLSWQAHV